MRTESVSSIRLTRGIHTSYVSTAIAALMIGAVLFALERRAPSVNESNMVVVYKTPTCQCCSKWVDHLRQEGFSVTVHNKDSLALVKQKFGVPEAMESCHTASISGYVIEGHVPAADIRRLLKERPLARGIGVAGMPIGSPGMEQEGRIELYQTLLFDESGKVAVFSKHERVSSIQTPP